jgi:polyribonucleotide nucleotidyltransferase
MEFCSVTREIYGKKITLETGKMAKLADGAVVAKMDSNTVIVTACMSKNVPEGVDFFPLTVHYIEKFYASGKIPGGYFKREGKLSDREILISRLIDRPIRPLFPDGFYNEVQVIATALAANSVTSVDILGILGASAALSVSPIPFAEPAGGARIAYKNGEYIVNPTIKEIEESQMDIVVAGTRGGITMVEGGSKEVSKEILLKALDIGQEVINTICDMIDELVAMVKPQKIAVTPPVKFLDDALRSQLKEFAAPQFRDAAFNADKKARSAAVEAVVKAALEKFAITKEHLGLKEAKLFLEEVEIEVIRGRIVNEGIRPDFRKPDEIRKITVEVDVLENVHGSALFTRGQTQSLGIVTLGTSEDVQFIDSMEGEVNKRFMLHYNFPPFSTGEVKKSLAPSRREVGHGHLAERAVEAILPGEQEFPYTIRMVSEVLESNGSSSMATVCSSSLALMATGVPIKKAVAGIAMGLVWDKENNKYQVLSDIQGLEDHYGDMDFKVAGTKDGITGFQMDVKTIGLTREIMSIAINQALAGQAFILSKMNEIISEPRKELAPTAPKIKAIKIPETEIGLVIGSGGRVIKKLMADYGVSINIEDNGTVSICGKDNAVMDQLIEVINRIAYGFEKGQVVEGPVTRIEDYGIFVELCPGQNGLLHRSNIKGSPNPKEKYKMGERVQARILDINERKQIALIDMELDPATHVQDRPRDRDRGGYGRDRDRGGEHRGGYERHDRR